jgi:hypothetical protein
MNLCSSGIVHRDTKNLSNGILQWSLIDIRCTSVDVGTDIINVPIAGRIQ